MGYGQNGANGMTVANHVELELKTEIELAFHPDLVVWIVPAVLPKLLNAILILVPVSYNNIY